MNKHFLLSILFLVFNLNIYSQITSSTQSLSFSQTTVGQSSSKTLYIRNLGSEAETIYQSSFSGYFSILPANLTINPNDSILVTVNFLPGTNILVNDVLYFYNSDTSAGTAINVSGIAKFNDLYDSFTYNKFDAELKSALSSYTANHTSLGYNTARDRMFDTIDKQPGDTIECVYTGRKIKAVDRTAAQNQNFNTEHSWPQSTFSEAEPMRSDIYHLYPTDATANSIRSNYPFGAAVSNITWQIGGSKRGTGSNGAIVFEPRDSHKGDVSRAMLYFVIRYPVNYGSFMSTYQEDFFRSWGESDPVSALELARNTSIAGYQGKRNPFIDHPDFVDRIYSFSTSSVRPQIALAELFPAELNMPAVSAGSNSDLAFFIVNSGNTSLTVSNISASNNTFTILNTVSSVAAHSSARINVRFSPQAAGTFSELITVTTSAGNRTIMVSGTTQNPGGNSSTFTVSSGWNIISVPLAAPDMNVLTLFPTATSQAYTFNNGYQSVSTLSNGEGYWLKFDQASDVTINGNTILQNIPISSGWNMVGPFGQQVLVSAISTNPPGIINSNFFGYQNSYSQVNILNPGNGYWVKSLQSGELVLSSPGKNSEFMSFNGFPYIKITDASGIEFILYTRLQEKEFNELPPLPPHGIKDVRYDNGTYAENLDSRILGIDIHSLEYPIKIASVGNQLDIYYYSLSGNIRHTLTEGAEHIINDASVNKIFAGTSLSPKHFSLSQNYPNPFNPETVIHYELPIRSTVSLKVYDVLGNLISELVNGLQEAGVHSVSFNASELTSGVYFYAIAVNGGKGNIFNEVKKMMLMK